MKQMGSRECFDYRFFQTKSPFLRPLEQRYNFGPSNKVSNYKKLVIKSGVCFLILFVLVDAILQKVIYFKNKSGTGVFFLALCLYLMVIIDNSSLFCLYIFVLEDLAFFPTVPLVQPSLGYSPWAIPFILTLELAPWLPFQTSHYI